MKFGVRLIEYLGGAPQLLRLATLADEAGADSVWFPHDPFMRQTWALTSAAAVQTRKVSIGAVGVNPYTTDPSEITTWIATLDELSGGRAILGIGLHTDRMMAWTGYDASDCAGRVEEAVELIRRLLRGEIVTSDTRHFRWNEQCYLRFKPLRATIPIYVSSFGDAFHELAGRIGDGSQPMLTPPADAARVVPVIRRGVAQSGRARESHAVSGCAWLSLAADGALAAARMRSMIAYFGSYLEDAALAQIGLTHADFAPIRARVDAGDYAGAEALVTDQMLKLAIVGTPRQVIRQIEELAAAGVDEVGLGGPLGPDPAAAIELLGREVMPYFRR